MSTKILGDSGVLYTDRRDFYISPYVVKELWTDVAPFTTLVANRGTMTPPDPIFKMFEHRAGWIKQEFIVNSAIPGTMNASDSGVEQPSGGYVPVDGATGVSLDNSLVGLECEVWDTTKTTKKGVVLITSYSSGVKGKVLSGTDVVLADNDVFVVIGNAQGEASSSPEAFSDELQVVWNSTQIFRTPVEISGTLLAAALRGERNELARLRDLKSKEHKIQKERAFLFGLSPLGIGAGADTFNDNVFKTDAAGKKVRATTGIISALQKYGTSSGDYQNLFTISAALYDYGKFVDDMEKVFLAGVTYNSGEKYAFCGPGAMSYWSKLATGNTFSGKSGWNVQISATQKDNLGFNVRILETPHGILKLVPTPVLRDMYSKTMLIVSDENLQHVQYRPAMFHANIKTDNNPDLVKDEFMSDEGVGITMLESHKLVTITA